METRMPTSVPCVWRDSEYTHIHTAAPLLTPSVPSFHAEGGCEDEGTGAPPGGEYIEQAAVTELRCDWLTAAACG